MSYRVCKECDLAVDPKIWSHCPECGYPYNLPVDKRPNEWTKEVSSTKEK